MLSGKLNTTIQCKHNNILFVTIGRERNLLIVNIQQYIGELAHHSSLAMVKRDEMEEMRT